MTATLPDVAAKKKQAEQSAEQQATAELVRLAKKQGSSRPLADELLKQLTKTVLETALNEEMTEHLGAAISRTRMAPILTGCRRNAEVALANALHAGAHRPVLASLANLRGNCAEFPRRRPRR